MRFQKPSVEELRSLKDESSNLQTMIRIFIESDEPVYKIVDWEDRYKNLSSAYNAFYGAIRKGKIDGVHVYIRKAQLFLVKD